MILKKKWGGLVPDISGLAKIPDVSEKVKNCLSSIDIETIKDKKNLKDLFNTYEINTKSVLTFADGIKNGTISLKQGQSMLQGYIAYMKAAQTATTVTALKTKVLSASMKVLSAIGWMAALTAITALINKGMEAVNNYVHRLDNAKEALSNTQSELSELGSKIDETNRKIAELESKETLSLTDKADLDQLRQQNEELKIRQKYLEMQERGEKETVAQYSKEKYNQKYGANAGNAEDIEKYKNKLLAPKKASTLPAYLTGDHTPTSTPYAAGQQNQTSEEGTSLSALLAQYEVYSENRKEAFTNDDTSGFDSYNTKLKTIQSSLIESREELAQFRDDLIVSGASGKELEAINYQLQQIDSTLLAPGKNLKKFLDSKTIAESKNELIRLSLSGELTAESLKSNFSEVDDYIQANGISFERFIQILKSQVPEVSFGVEDQNPDPFQLQSVQSNLNSHSLLSTAVKELSGSGTLTQATFNSLKPSFSDLDSILVQTASGVEVNRQDERVK